MRLDDVLWEHVCSLSEPAQQLLQVVALAGRSIELAVARTAAGVAAELRDALDTLRMQRLVRTQGLRASDLVEPYHDRIREVVTERLDEDRTRSLHLALARALEGTGRADPEALVVHYRGAGKTGLAWKFAVIAGDRAASTLAFRRAADLYREALELDPQRESQSIRIKMADALASAGHGAEASAMYLEAAESARHEDALELRRRAAEQSLRVGHVDRGLSLLEDMLAAAGMKLAKTPLRALQSLLMHRAWLRIRGFGYRGRYELDQEALRRIDIGWALVAGLSNSDPIRGADIQTRTLLLALETGEPSRIARGIALEAATAATEGPKNHGRGAKLLERAKVLANKLGDPYTVGCVHAAFGVTAYFEGRFQDCIDESELVLKHLANRPGAAWERTTTRHYAIWALMWLGHVATASRRVREQLEAAMERGDLYSATDLRIFLSNLAWLADDDVEGGRRAIEDAMKGWSKRGFHAQHYYEMYARGQLDIYCGEGDNGVERVNDAWSALRSSMLLQIQSVRIETLHLRGRCALSAALRNPAKRSRFLSIAESDAKRLAREYSIFSPAMAEAHFCGRRTYARKRRAVRGSPAGGASSVRRVGHASVRRGRGTTAWRGGGLQRPGLGTGGHRPDEARRHSKRGTVDGVARARVPLNL